MKFRLTVTVAASALAAPVLADKLGLGRPALPEEVAAWDVTVLPDGTRRFTAWIWKDGAMREVLSRRFSAEGA